MSDYVRECLREDEEFILYRARASAAEVPSVLLLTLASIHPRLESLKKIEHEYSLCHDLDTTWAVRPLSLSQCNGQKALVLEDPGGEFLHRLIQGPMEIKQFLSIAIGLSTALSELHNRSVIHKDLKPSNVLVDAATGHAWLTGFGIASRLPRERQSPGPPEFIAGTLPYMAPEQTGRMNRSIDSRSDLYALGVTLYEILTGSPPFTASEPMEWVYCHIARLPIPPSERVPNIPGPVSAIVMKLLAKTAEERYQTAIGLERDFRRCLEDWETRHHIDEFPLGEQDFPDRLMIPEKLYGREREVDALLAAFDRVVTQGRPELVLVSGYSGVGKSSVVNELHKALVPPRGLFASGKFDQYKRDIPYATLAQAFQSLVRPLLSKTEAELRVWREALLEALGPNGRLMDDVVPELKLIIGEPPPVPELPPQDAQRRFQLVFRRFIGVFARPEHPLALFLDDLQWLDAATLDLLEDMLTQSDLQHLMLIGAYRDNEVTAVHPLTRKLEIIKIAGGKVAEIALAPLARGHLGQLIADALRCEPEQAAPLAQLVHEKTGGNPFFAIQFISSLADERMLTFDHAVDRWSWDRDRIHARGYTDNVVELMVGKLTRLPAETQNALQQLACLGNIAEITTLAIVLGLSEEQVHTDLYPAVRQELVERLAGSYRFVHDRVQEGAYSLIPEELRDQTHLRIGRLLVAHIVPEKQEEAIFDIVNQLNRGSHFITSNDERRRVAEFNLIAARRAKISTAYASALSYLATGRTLLVDANWDTDYELILSLEYLTAQCELLTADMESAEKRLSTLVVRANNSHDLASVTRLQLTLYTVLNRLDRGIEICLEHLRRGGTNWSAHPTSDEVQREYDRIWSLLGDRKIEDLLDLPLVTDPDILDVLDVLTEIVTPAVFFDKDLCALVICRMVNLSLEHGNSDASCFAYVWFGIVVGPRFGKYEDAFRFGQLGYDLLGKRGLRRYEARTCMCFSVVVPWTKHARHSRDLVRHAFDVAYRMGDFTYAAYSFTQLLTNYLVVGDPLAKAHAEAERGVAFAKSVRLGLVVDIVGSDLQLIRSLQGLTHKFGSFNDSEFDEAEFERHLASNPALADPGFGYWTLKAQARFFAHDYASAVDASLRAQQLLWAAPTLLEQAAFQFYGALSHAAAWNFASPHEKRKHFEALSAHHKQLEIWEEHCPSNFENRLALVSAEIARIEDRMLDAEGLYEKAIRSAHENGFIHNEAVAYEVTARFYAARGFDKVADSYLREARYCYLRWGADGKVKQLDQLYPHLTDGDPTRGATSTIAAPAELLDLATVIKVSQALSAEMDLDRLIETAMRAALEHAGAVRGLLILSRGDGQHIGAEATSIGDQVLVRRNEAARFAVPQSIVNYVARTHEFVILDDATGPGRFVADTYFSQHHVRSVLCLPLITQGKLVAIMYLENSLASHVFTTKRISVLKMLAAQVAISLENTQLYADLRQREAKIRRLVDANIMAVVIWRLDGAIVESNEAFLRMVQYDREDVATARVRWTDLTPTEWREHDERALAEIRATGSVQPYEKELFRRDGSRVPVLVAGALFEEGGSEGVAFALDLSELKRTEATLRKREAYLAESQRLAHTGSWAIDGTTREALYWSEEMFRIFGFDPQQGLPKRDEWLQRMHPEDRDKVRQEASDRMFLQKVDADLEYRIVLPDGTFKHVRGLAHPVVSPDGELVEVLGTVADVTERILAEEALKRSETYLAQAQRVANIGSWVFDTVRMKPVYLSTEWHRLQDFDPKDSMPTWEQRLQRIHPEDRARYEEGFNRAIAEKSDLDTEFRILLPDSTVRCIRSVGHPVLDALGEVTQMMGVIMDVTESRQAEQEHERLRQELAHLSHLNRISTIGELTASLAHEIKQPIGAAVTNAQACLRFLDGDRLNLIEAREAALEMTRDATRAAEIIDRVRSLYRKESSHQEMVDINDLIREMIVMLRDEAKRHSVTTRTDLAEGLPKVIADRVQLQQALMNLMLNGIEAMRDTTGELSIKSSLAGDRLVLISVTDAGVGLPSDKTDQIFDAFFTTKPQGTGLGLAITRSIIESHGGRVWATANSGRGTTFHFTLARQRAAHA